MAVRVAVLSDVHANLAALDAALASGDRDALLPVLETNVYRGGPSPGAARVAALADYLSSVAAATSSARATAPASR